MELRSSTPALALRGDRPGILRTILTLLALVAVLFGSWALLIAGVVVLVRAIS